MPNGSDRYLVGNNRGYKDITFPTAYALCGYNAFHNGSYRQKTVYHPYTATSYQNNTCAQTSAPTDYCSAVDMTGSLNPLSIYINLIIKY